jgi:transposase
LPVEPLVTRLHLFGGVCPHCARRFKAQPPAAVAPGSPFGANLRALAIYLRYTQGIGLERLARLFGDLFSLRISEGALVNLLGSAAPAFAEQSGRIRSDLLASRTLASDETGLRVGKRNFWLWVVHHKNSAVFLADKSRAKRVLEGFLGERRPDFWLSDRGGSQRGFARKAHQFCLAHLIRNARYAVEAGDACFAPPLIDLLSRACRVGARRSQLSDRQLDAYRNRFIKQLSRLIAEHQPTNAEGVKLRKAICRSRRNLFVFLSNREIEPTNNASERALRPCVTFRKITNGFRTEWGAKLYADIRSVIETARRRAIPPLEAIRTTLNYQPLAPNTS